MRGWDTVSAVVLAVVLAVAVALLAGCGERANDPGEVVVYTSVDQVYAIEVFRRFTEATGLAVKPVFDTEASKTTGLFRRLIAEKANPRADVFWNGEVCRTLQLVREGIADNLAAQVPSDIPKRWVDPEGRWVAFSLRARVIVYNTDRVSEEDAPKRLQDLTLPKWKGKVAIANPLFGTTATHLSALHVALGDEKAQAWLRALKENGVRVVAGNSVVRDVVGRGEVTVGLTDTDDVYAGIANGMSVDFVLPDQDGMGTLVIPNTVMIVKGGPNAENARRFVRFLLQPEVEELLAKGRARQLPCRDDVPRPADLAKFAGVKPMDVDYAAVAERIADVARNAEKILNQ